MALACGTAGCAMSAKLSSTWQRDIGRWTMASNWQSLIKPKGQGNYKYREKTSHLWPRGGSQSVGEETRKEKDKIFKLHRLCLSFYLQFYHQWPLLLYSNPPLFSTSSSGSRANPSASPPSPSSAATPPPPPPPSPSALALTQMNWSKLP